MKKLLLGILVLQITIFSAVFYSIAGEISFRCKVQYEYHFAVDGKLDEKDQWHFKNTSFEVERSTGRVVGTTFSIEPGLNDKIVESGEEGSFKLFNYIDKGKADFLAIKTWQKENGKMPFVFIDYLQTVLTGVCD